MYFLIGLDDTDSATTGATETLARDLGAHIEDRLGCRMRSVTRHQLLQNPAIRFTTSNGCTCILVEGDMDQQRDIELLCREYLLHESAVGANAGFALAPWNRVSAAITDWGKQAKRVPLHRLEAMETARASGVAIAGFTGNGNGVIGALAALGLYFDGNDGRFEWLPGLEGVQGTYSLGELLDRVSFDRVENLYGRKPLSRDRIKTGDWIRPVMRDGKSLLLVQSGKKEDPFEWSVLPRDKIEQLSA